MNQDTNPEDSSTEVVSKPFLIWSNYWNGWYKPKAEGYTIHLKNVGIFRDRNVDSDPVGAQEKPREIKVYLDDPHPTLRTLDDKRVSVREVIRMEIKQLELDSNSLASLEEQLE